MAGVQITVVADSIPLRESVEIALGARYTVAFVSSEEAHRNPRILADCALVIAEAGGADCALAARLLRVTTGPHDHEAPTCIAFPFRPEQLRYAVERALAAPPDGAGTRLLRPPLIPAAAARLAEAAAHTRVPVLIAGEAGTGKRRLARQIHLAGGGGAFAAIPAARLTPDAVLLAAGDGRTTYLITNIERCSARGLETLRELLDDHRPGAAAGQPRVIVTTEVDPDGLAATGVLEPDLWCRLSVLPITLPPLRGRSAEISEIAAAVLAQQRPAHHAAAELPRLGDAARERLRRYPWPGNLTELEAVLVRSALLHTGAEIRAEDLVFDVAGIGQRPTDIAADAAPQATQPPGVSTAGELGALLHELAHELKNPMVAIKTAAQHLARGTSTAPEQTEAAQLAGAAVDRMDRVVENMLQFARFDGVRPERVRLVDVLGPALDALIHEIDGRRIQLDDRTDAKTTVWVDRLQATYALENLLRASLRAAGDGAPLGLRSERDATLCIEFPASTGSVAAKLAKWSDGPLLGPLLDPSIYLVFARELIERNGGSVTVTAGDGRTTVRVTLPQQPGEEEADDEETARLDR